HLALSDFVAPAATGLRDYVGMFAVGVFGVEELVRQYEQQHDDYNKILIQVRWPAPAHYAACSFTPADAAVAAAIATAAAAAWMLRPLATGWRRPWPSGCTAKSG
ncbi:MAG: vitamin B12 dependent-methionine synthase activation domain-containing protein, partial [Hydrogenophaga sp.]